MTQSTRHGSGNSPEILYTPRSRSYQGRYGRMFANLPPFDIPSGMDTSEVVNQLVKKAYDEITEEEDSNIPAGYTYFGQFIAHDITFNPLSSLTKRRDPESLHNFRTPTLDLDSVYGRGPKDEPFLYERPDEASSPGRLAVRVSGPNEADLPRTKSGVAVIGDPRNDEHTIISQFHLAFLKFHNYFYDKTNQNFGEAQRLTCWHFQWLVIHDYLNQICNKHVVAEILNYPGRPQLKYYNWKRWPFVPVEFSGAAFRFGHSMVRAKYLLNQAHFGSMESPLFSGISTNNLEGFRNLPRRWTIQWDLFFEFGHKDFQRSRKINRLISSELRNLPHESFGLESEEKVSAVEKDLVFRNLRRGLQLQLPTGQSVAKSMGIKPIESSFDYDYPLWWYVLLEAENEDGNHLGEVGSRIVAETIIGLILGDPLSYLNLQPDWSPKKENHKMVPHSSEFTIQDVFRCAEMPTCNNDIESLISFTDPAENADAGDRLV